MKNLKLLRETVPRRSGLALSSWLVQRREVGKKEGDAVGAADGTVAATPALATSGSGPCGHATVRRAAEVRGWWWRVPKQRCPAPPWRIPCPGEGGRGAGPLPRVLPSEGPNGDRAGKEGAEVDGKGRVSPAGASRRGLRFQAPGLPSRSWRAWGKTARGTRSRVPS